MKVENPYESTNRRVNIPLGNGFSRSLESRFLIPKNEAQCSHFRPMGPFFFRYRQSHLKYSLFSNKMMFLLLTVPLQVFKIRKRGRKIIKVDSKS